MSSCQMGQQQLEQFGQAAVVEYVTPVHAIEQGGVVAVAGVVKVGTGGHQGLHLLRVTRPQG